MFPKTKGFREVRNGTSDSPNHVKTSCGAQCDRLQPLLKKEGVERVRLSIGLGCGRFDQRGGIVDGKSNNTSSSRDSSPLALELIASSELSTLRAAGRWPRRCGFWLSLWHATSGVDVPNRHFLQNRTWRRSHRHSACLQVPRLWAP